MFLPCRTQFFFLLRGHKMDLFSPCGAIKSTLWPARGEIMEMLVFINNTIDFNNLLFLIIIKTLQLVFIVSEIHVKNPRLYK